MEQVLTHIVPCVVSKSDSNHGTATTAHRTLALTAAGTICCSNLSLSYYPIRRRGGGEGGGGI